MKKYLVDTNVFLRFFLKDNQEQYGIIVGRFEEAVRGKTTLRVLPETIFEISYVLEKVYELTKNKIIELIDTVIKSDYLDVENRDILINTASLFSTNNIDISDAYLQAYADKNAYEILTFDNDFKKLKRSKAING